MGETGRRRTRERKDRESILLLYVQNVQNTTMDTSQLILPTSTGSKRSLEKNNSHTKAKVLTGNFYTSVTNHLIPS